MRTREAPVINRDAADQKLTEFSRTDTYSIIYSDLLKRREKVIRDGKAVKDANLWAKLEGFDYAATVVEDAVNRIQEQAIRAKESNEDEE